MKKTIILLITTLIFTTVPIQAFAEQWKNCYAKNYNINYMLPISFQKSDSVPFAEFAAIDKGRYCFSKVTVLDLKNSTNKNNISSLDNATNDQLELYAKTVLKNMMKNGYDFNHSYTRIANKKCLAIKYNYDIQNIQQVFLTFIFVENYKHISFMYQYPAYKAIDCVDIIRQSIHNINIDNV